MTIVNIICFLLGSLVSLIFALILFRRQRMLDERLIRHIRSKAYNEGWMKGRDEAFADPLNENH